MFHCLLIVYGYLLQLLLRYVHNFFRNCILDDFHRPETHFSYGFYKKMVQVAVVAVIFIFRFRLHYLRACPWTRLVINKLFEYLLD